MHQFNIFHLITSSRSPETVNTVSYTIKTTNRTIDSSVPKKASTRGAYMERKNLTTSQMLVYMMYYSYM